MRPQGEPALVDQQCAAISHALAADPALPLPRLLPADGKRFWQNVADSQGNQRMVWVQRAFTAVSYTHLDVYKRQVRDLTVRPEGMRAFLDRGFPTATDLADWLVREAGIPFRDAHHITARVVALAEAKGCTCLLYTSRCV